MRILKSMRPLASEECAYFTSRLKVLVARGKAELSFYDICPEPAKPPTRPRLFWTPEELRVGSDDD
jgi:hypothetical protein